MDQRIFSSHLLTVSDFTEKETILNLQLLKSKNREAYMG